MHVLFLIFFFFSIFGYIVECIYSSILLKKVNFDRGFFFGPYLPIYGFTITLIYVISKYVDSLLFVFLSAILITTVEYLTAFILELFFRRKWWDYTRKKYNIKGRVCLDNIIIFTLSSYIISKFVIQYLEKVLLENKIFTLSFFIFTLLVFIVDLILSIKYNYNCSKKKG